MASRFARSLVAVEAERRQEDDATAVRWLAALSAIEQARLELQLAASDAPGSVVDNPVRVAAIDFNVRLFGRLDRELGGGGGGGGGYGIAPYHFYAGYLVRFFVGQLRASYDRFVARLDEYRARRDTDAYFRAAYGRQSDCSLTLTDLPDTTGGGGSGGGAATIPCLVDLDNLLVFVAYATTVTALDVRRRVIASIRALATVYYEQCVATDTTNLVAKSSARRSVYCHRCYGRASYSAAAIGSTVACRHLVAPFENSVGPSTPGQTNPLEPLDSDVALLDRDQLGIVRKIAARATVLADLATKQRAAAALPYNGDTDDGLQWIKRRLAAATASRPTGKRLARVLHAQAIGAGRFLDPLVEVTLGRFVTALRELDSDRYYKHLYDNNTAAGCDDDDNDDQPPSSNGDDDDDDEEDGEDDNRPSAAATVRAPTGVAHLKHLFNTVDSSIYDVAKKKLVEKAVLGGLTTEAVHSSLLTPGTVTDALISHLFAAELALHVEWSLASLIVRHGRIQGDDPVDAFDRTIADREMVAYAFLERCSVDATFRNELFCAQLLSHEFCAERAGVFEERPSSVLADQLQFFKVSNRFQHEHIASLLSKNNRLGLLNPTEASALELWRSSGCPVTDDYETIPGAAWLYADGDGYLRQWYDHALRELTVRINLSFNVALALAKLRSSVENKYTDGTRIGVNRLDDTACLVSDRETRTRDQCELKSGYYYLPGNEHPYTYVYNTHPAPDDPSRGPARTEIVRCRSQYLLYYYIIEFERL